LQVFCRLGVVLLSRSLGGGFLRWRLVLVLEGDQHFGSPIHGYGFYMLW
jgi:hypothetical protein